MRIAFLPDGGSANAAYRSLGPMMALAERGHEVRRLDLGAQRSWGETLRWCDLLHVHRVCDGGAVELARSARAAGAAVVWDDDDDVTRAPRALAGQGVSTGVKGTQRRAARAKLFALADLVTTPSPVLAAAFHAGGARHVQVIENYPIDRFARDRMPRDGLRVGWVAGSEHKLDLERVPLRDALERLLDAHPQLHVTTVGLRLDLASPRYAHVPPVPITELLSHVSTFDVGLAPLSPDWAINHARSNIKLKEYAAMGVPWLASPIGPYAGLGEREGGRLVADDRWREELDALICGGRARRKLASRAARWGREQMLSRNVGCWERALTAAVARAHAAAA